MAEAQSNHITDEHYAAFGRIVNTMAEIDAVLDGIIVAMAKGTMEVVPRLPMVGSKNKGDSILGMGNEEDYPDGDLAGCAWLMMANARSSSRRLKFCGNTA